MLLDNQSWHWECFPGCKLARSLVGHVHLGSLYANARHLRNVFWPVCVHGHVGALSMMRHLISVFLALVWWSFHHLQGTGSNQTLYD